MQDKNIIWRLDDRLIHGQVIVGWCGQLPIKRMVVIDDFISINDWEKQLLLLATPPHLASEIISTKETSGRMDTWKMAKELTLVLFKAPITVKILMQD